MWNSRYPPPGVFLVFCFVLFILVIFGREFYNCQKIGGTYVNYQCIKAEKLHLP